MAVTGNQRKASEGISKYVGLTSVQVVAINPTKSELNKLLGKEDNDEDKPIEYLGEDKQNVPRLRLVFWLFSEETGRYFPYSFNLTKKERTNKDGDKNQYVNSVCITTWPKVAGEENFPEWFTNFVDPKTKEDLGSKTYRKALMGEEELATLLRNWLGRLNFNSPDCSVIIDTDRLFNEDYTELKELIDSDFDSNFVALTGIRTDENDNTKQYQQVYGKSFLPDGFMQHLTEDGLKKGVSEYVKKTWNRFVDEVEGQYGFDGHTELVPIKVYNPDEDIAAGEKPAVAEEAKPAVSPQSSKF